MGFLRRVIDFVAHPTHSRTMGLVVMLALVAAVSLTVIVAQQQQQIRQRAAETEDLPSPISIAACESKCRSDNLDKCENTEPVAENKENKRPQTIDECLKPCNDGCPLVEQFSTSILEAKDLDALLPYASKMYEDTLNKKLSSEQFKVLYFQYYWPKFEQFTPSPTPTPTPTLTPNTVSVDINLDKGYNLISLPVTPLDSAITTLISSIKNEIRIIYYYDLQTNHTYIFRQYIPTTISGATGSGDFSVLESGKVYLFIMNKKATLTLTGAPFEFQPIPLQENKPYAIGAPFSSVKLSEISGTCDTLKLQLKSVKNDGSFEVITLDPNTLLESKKGYWISSTNNCTLSKTDASQITPSPTPTPIPTAIPSAAPALSSTPAISAGVCISKSSVDILKQAYIDQTGSPPPTLLNVNVLASAYNLSQNSCKEQKK